MTAVTDEMLRAAIRAMRPDRIQGFLYDRDTPHPVRVIRDLYKEPGKQEIFRALVEHCDEVEWHDRLEMERLRVGFTAALSV